jgi:CubicO group peptidase (beta-lactamase class C family)
LVDDQGAAALETRVLQLATVALNHPPGQTYEYANVNYTVLGQIIQVVSGHPYEDAIREQIVAPLQMLHSAATLTDPAVSDVASGYRF